MAKLQTKQMSVRGAKTQSRVNRVNLKQQKAANKVAFAKKKKDLKLKRMEADNDARIAKTKLRATIKTQKAQKKYGFDQSLSSEQKTKLKMAEMQHQTARIASAETAGTVTSLAGGLGGASISMQQAHFGREDEPTVPNSQSQPNKPSTGQQSSPSLDDILAGIGK